VGSSRREFLAQIGAAGVTCAATGLVPGPHRIARGAPGPARPSPAQAAWQDHEIGMFVHFAPNTWQDREYDDRSTPLSAIDPDIDTDQWVSVAEALGARYVVLVAKHVGGFCLWQTETTDYGIRNTPWRHGRGDVMADLGASCARRGLGLGVYLSPRDDTFGAGQSGRCATPEAQARYDAVYRRQLVELLTGYGPIMELWLDGSSVVPTGDLVRRYAPAAMVFQGPQATIRWVGNEDGFAPYPAWNALAASDAASGVATALHGDPDGDVWMPIEVDVSLRRPNWFWSTTNHVNILSLDALLEIYYRSVGRGAQLLLNVTPDRSGHVPEADARRVAEFGSAIRRRFASPLAEADGRGRELVVGLPAPGRVDHVVLAEDIAGGERVRAYRLEGRAGGRWRPLGSGSAIGHKRIQPVGPVDVDAVRLVVTASAAEPLIARLAVYDTGVAPPATWAEPARLWADDAVGEWSGETLVLDLSTAIAAPGTFRLRLVSGTGEQVTLRDPVLSIGGIAQPRLARAEPGRADVLRLTITEIGSRIALQAVVDGAARGTVLLRRL
jgi:alpha-L-fucosidase